MKLPIRQAISLLFFFAFLLPATSAQFVNFEQTWKEFLAEEKTSNISKITQPSKELKEDYAKYCLMFATVHFCGNKIGDAEVLMRDIQNLGVGTYSSIPGFKARYEDLVVKVKAYHNVEQLWRKFIQGDAVGPEALEKNEEAKRVCEKATLAKYNFMLAYNAYCLGETAKAKNFFENRVLKLAERTTLEIADVEGLESRVKDWKFLFQELPNLDKAWKTFTTSGDSPGFKPELPLVACYPVPSIKAHMLRAAVDICTYGAENLKAIQQLQTANSHPLDPDLKEKIDWLEKEVGRYHGDMANLDRAWKEFVDKDTLTSSIEYLFEYCEKEAQIKAYTMHGTIHACEQGREMQGKIKVIRDEFSPTLEPGTLDKIAKLEAKLNRYEEQSVALDTLWKSFIDNADTLEQSPQLAGFYCDKIDQIKSYTIKGRLEACAKGQQYLDRIDELQQAHQLAYDKELECAVSRLRAKVWDCRYWELVLQARKETHAERERFGPASAKIMEGDLNSDQLPCPTTVQYEPLGNIGIKYVISTFLCQEIDLAKMGDPEYYKKIATWVDGEVLQKYCEESMRCKEDFFIYLEGHTDGHVFKGARYKESLGIPEGTPFTHFTEVDTLQKTTERELTNALRSNMELGIARAWTVKHQLDFMQVPITIGAYEHPSSEKGGEYRRIEIELNITNLLLDFYEKRLAALLEASGIGDRPEVC